MRCFPVLSMLLIIFGFVCIECTANGDSNQTVDLGYAIYQGTYNSTSNITDFFGIPYSAPPIGKLRFQKPTPPPDMRVQGVQLANTVAQACPNAGLGTQETSPFRNLSNKFRRDNSSIEDCLYLNVHVSGKIDPNARMPVVFWIHGGGYVLGSGIGMNGADLIRGAGGGIVALEIQYRLGAFGFLAGSEVKKNGALNAGLLDQQFALEWAQKDIHLFGGDPNQVTIWGVSAGAGSVLQHLVAHGGNTQPRLFHQAITSSIFLPSQYNFDDPIPEKLYSVFVQMTGCSNATDTFQCLVEVDAGVFQAANVEVNDAGFTGVFTMVPVVDGEFIIERPIKTIERRRLNTKRLLSMSNAFEGTPFVNPNLTAQMALTEYVTQLFPLFNQTEIEGAAQQYTGIGLDTVVDQAIGIMGESIFVCPTYRLLNAFPGHSHKGLFAVPRGNHGDDIPYYFPRISFPPGVVSAPFKNAQFTASFVGSFLGFVKFGDPNVHPVADDFTPSWNTYIHGNTEMLFNRTEDFQIDIRAFSTDPGLIKRCAFWESVAPSIPQ